VITNLENIFYSDCIFCMTIFLTFYNPSQLFPGLLDIIFQPDCQWPEKKNLPAFPSTSPAQAPALRWWICISSYDFISLCCCHKLLLPCRYTHTALFWTDTITVMTELMKRTEKLWQLGVNGNMSDLQTDTLFSLSHTFFSANQVRCSFNE